MEVSELFDLSNFKHAKLVINPLNFQKELINLFSEEIKGYKVIKSNGEVINNSYIKGTVYLAEGAEIKPFTYIDGEVIIEKESIIGPQAYIRGKVIIGEKSKLSRCEVKTSIIMNEVNIHHHSYIGDSIIGNKVNIAAGFITANLRFDKSRIKVKGLGLSPTHKFGSLIGDNTKTMVNATLMPGSVIKKGGVVNCKNYSKNMTSGD